MENQRQFLSIALVCILAVLYFKWIDFNAEPVAPQQVQAQSDVPGLAAPASPTPQLNSQQSSVPQISSNTPADAANLGLAEATPATADLIEVDTDLVRAFINPLGGVIERLELKDQPVSLEKADQGYPLLKNAGRDFYVAQDGLLSLKQGRAPNHTSPYVSPNDSYQLGSSDELLVPLSWTSADGLKVQKTFRFKRDSHVVGVEYQINNVTKTDWVGYHYGQISRTPPEQTGGSFGRLPSYTGAAYYTPEEKYTKVDFGDIEDQNLKLATTKTWAGMLEHYFVSVWLPSTESNSLYTGHNKQAGQYRIGYQSSQASTIAAGSSGSVSSQLYVGPKEQSRLKKLEKQGFSGLNLTVDYGFLTFIADPLFVLLGWIHSIVGNWGWSIILLTVLIKAAFYPLSAASYKSMAGMKKLQPRIQTLKERYKDDRQKFQTEMMALYKQEKINPAGGCLPILIQIPVFIALYWVLLESVEIRQAPFALWWQDLSAPDPYYVLPILMGVSMYLMQKLNPAPMEDIQKKVMMILPFALTFLFLTFPQGLVLYWVVNNILSMAQQWYINKKHAS